MSAEDTTKLIEDARSGKLGTDGDAMRYLADAVESLVAEEQYQRRTKDAALAGLGRYEKRLQKVEAERDALRAENDNLRGPDSDQRDALITDPLIRQIQALRAQLDSIRSALINDRVILVEKRNGYTVENYANPLVPVRSIEAVLGVSE